jgi:hypothetical protein
MIDWAIGGDGPPPRGDLRDAEDLAEPPDRLREAARRLVAATAARLRWGHPPLGDPRPLGAATIVLAAILGAPDPDRLQLAGLLLPILDEPDATAGDLVGRHGLLAPALLHLPEPMADDCRARSPLTAVLERPAPGQESSAVATARRILEDARGRASLQLHLARPTDDARVRRWRAELLDRLWRGDEAGRQFVLDVYEAAMIHHRPRALEQIDGAGEVLRSSLAARDGAALRDAMAVADWWGPLWMIHRQDIDALRARPYLHIDFLEGLRLYQLRRRMMGGVA